MAWANPMMSEISRSVVTYWESACTVPAMVATSAASSFFAMADSTRRWFAARNESPSPYCSYA